MRITFLGDAMMQPEQLPLYERSGQYDFTECFEGIKDFLKSSDYVVANLETPVADTGKDGLTNKLYEFNTPKEFACALKEVGVNLVTTANNHCLDRGLAGLFSTAENLEKIGLEFVGTRKEPGNSFVIKKIGGVNVGFLAFTYGTNAFANNNYLKAEEYQYVDMLQNQEISNKFDFNLLYNRKYPYKIARVFCKLFGVGQLNVAPYERREKNRKRLAYYYKQIRKCRKQGADVIISLLHIGGQYNDEPSDYTKEMCRKSFEHGVDIVVANHEHVIHGWDYYDGHFCEHSIGNLVSVNGVIVEPFDKMAEFSMALHADFENADDVRYSFSIIHSVLKEDGRIVCVPVYEEWMAADDVKKLALEEKVNAILNRLYRTGSRQYKVLAEYSIGS